jgi:hypothetical protein
MATGILSLARMNFGQEERIGKKKEEEKKKDDKPK